MDQLPLVCPRPKIFNEIISTPVNKQYGVKMNESQLNLVTGLLRMTSEPIIKALKLVLLEGMKQADAARDAGCRPNHLARALAQVKELHEKIEDNYK